MVGTGPPVDLQVISTLLPSEMVTFSSCPSLIVVLGFSIKKTSSHLNNHCRLNCFLTQRAREGY